jgi:uncharacterized protein
MSPKINLGAQVARFSVRRYRWILAAALGMSLLSGFFITRLQFQSDVLNLLPANAPRTAAFVKFLREFGATDSLFIVLERPSGKEVESLGPFAEVLTGRLMETGEFSEIYGRLNAETREKMAALFLRKALLFPPPEELPEIEKRLSREAIRERVKNLKAGLHSLFSSPLSRYDLLDLWPVISRRLPVKQLGGEPDSAGYLISDDRKLMLLITRPKGAAPDIDYDERLFRKVETAVRLARETAVREKNVGPEDLNDLQIGFAGGYMTALEDSRTLKKELILNFSVSLIGVLALFVLAFRSGISLFYALVPLALSPLLTLGLFSPFLGRLSESMGAFSAMILGLSIDFIILLYARYLEERNSGESLTSALETSLGHTGPGIFTGAVTTAAAYFALLISNFRGIQELGYLTGTGILIGLGCAFFLFPALIAAWDGRKKPRSFKGISSFLGLERLAIFSCRHPFSIILFCTLAMLVAIPGALQVHLNNDPRRLRPESFSSIALENKIRDKMGAGQDPILILAERNTLEELLEVEDGLNREIEKGRSSGVPVSRVENLASFLPPLSRQKRNLEWMRERKEIFDAGRVEKELRDALGQEGLRPEAFAPAFTMIREILGNGEGLTWAQYQRAAPKELGRRFLLEQNGRYTGASYVHVPPHFWTHPETAGFLARLNNSGPGMQVTGARLVQRELEGLMSREIWPVLLLALAGVFALIYFDFRSWRLSVISLLPVLLSSVWTLGIMGASGMDLNFMNVVVFTLVLGIGVDYGVHILHRAREGGPGGGERDLLQVGRGVVVAALTTLMGFGSLTLSGYPGLRSMGAVALLGVGFSLFLSLTLVPVLFQIISPQRRRETKAL